LLRTHESASQQQRVEFFGHDILLRESP
jgi:hypothetical protein